MKKFISLFLAAIMMLASLAACGGNTPSGDGDTTTTAPEAPGPFADYTYKRVVILGIDGMGAFNKDAETPNMDRIFADGATTYNARTSVPSISAQCWGSLLIGSSAVVHGLTNSIVDSTPYENTELPTIFKRVRDAMPDATLASFCHWSPVNKGIIEDGIDVYKANGEDKIIHEDMVTYFAENDPTLFYSHFDSPDGAGHGNGYGSEKHLAQITVVDEYIGKVYDALVQNNKIEDTLFIVVADHGGTNNGRSGNHGGYSDGEMNIFFGAAGKSVKKGSTITDMNIRDVAAIALYALGIDVPEFNIDGFSAQVPEGLFEDCKLPERQPIAAGESTFTTLSTPAKDGGKYITDYIGADKVSSVFHFNNDVSDAVGSASSTGKYSPKYYGTGYFDSCIEVGTQGCVLMPDVLPSEESFSVSVWFDHSPALSGYVLFGSHSASSTGKVGFSAVHNGSEISVTIGNGGSSYSLPIPLSEMTPNGWNNLTLVFDRDEGILSCYLNFEKVCSEKYSKRFSAVKYANSESFVFGNDSTGEFNDINLMMDELVVFNAALTDEDVASLAKFYQYEVK